MGGLADTIDYNWKEMSDQICLMQKTLLDQMEKLLSKTEEREEAQIGQGQDKGRTRAGQIGHRTRTCPI